jgi:hypothetical protein
MFECVLKNHSQQIVYFQIKRASQSMAGKTVVGEPKLSPLVCIVPPFSYQRIALQSLPDITVADGMIGLIDLEIWYGDERDNLEFKFTYESTPQLGVIMQRNGDASLSMNAPITKHIHEKV